VKYQEGKNLEKIKEMCALKTPKREKSVEGLMPEYLDGGVFQKSEHMVESLRGEVLNFHRSLHIVDQREG
jgi:hypothetical protein